MIIFLPEAVRTKPAHPKEISTAEIKQEVIANGLEFPWALTFLPDGNMLVTERPGQMRIVSMDGNISEPLRNVPEVFYEGQGGLLDVITDPDDEIYFSYAEPGKDGKASTAVAKAQLSENSLENVQVLFSQKPKVSGGNHFGSRLAVTPDNHLFIGLGERFDYSEKAQQLDNHFGKVIRLNLDGSVPEDNPFVDQEDALPEIWSYGHRNIQGMDVHPATGKVWIHEHGPRGGDEINIPEAGKNYGWPEASYGSNYSMIPIEDSHAAQGFEEPLYYWKPSIAPSGMLIYSGNLFDDWQGDIFVGALAGQHLAHLKMNGSNVKKEYQMLTELEQRIRDVAQGPDGAIYVLTDSDDGQIIRLSPAN